MDRLLPVFNKLQQALAPFEGSVAAPSLPQIVVVGSQSSGKSSVLESFVGCDFLPRGSGIVTRRPLLLQLVHVDGKGSDPKGDTYGEFGHLEGQRFYNFRDICAEIEAETTRKLGKSKRVSAEPIQLCIRSPHVLDLSLVDLPGVTKVPVDDQPVDIEAQLHRMVMQYIRNPNAIILAVSPATADIATSDAIQLARKVDPQGERTMGVITKLDLMDEGTDALEVLQGRVIPLKRGFVGVVNRSQRDINERKPLSKALASEAVFFETHPQYRPLAPQMGSGFLASRLNELLLSHIKNALPSLGTQLSSALSSRRAELRSYGEPLLDGESNRGALLLTLLTRFCTNYSEAIDGTSALVQASLSHSQSRTQPVSHSASLSHCQSLTLPVSHSASLSHSQSLTQPVSHTPTSSPPLLPHPILRAYMHHSILSSRFDTQEAARQEDDLFGGARIQSIFLTEFTDTLSSLDACEGLTNADISHAIRQATGPRAPLFVPDQSFDVLARRQIALLRPHCMQVVEQVLAELQRMVATCLPPQLKRFAKLRERVLNCAVEQLHKFAAPTAKMVGSLIDMELAYLNTGHPDFIGGKQAMRLIAQQLKQAELNDRRSPAGQQMPPPPPPNAKPPPPPATISDPLREVNAREVGERSYGERNSGERERSAARRANGGEEPSSFLNTFFGAAKKGGEVHGARGGGAHDRASDPLGARAYGAHESAGAYNGASYNGAGHNGAGHNAYGAQPEDELQSMHVGVGYSHSGKRSAQMEPETEIIRTLLISYFGIVRKNMNDLVPKAIMNFLVNAAKESMQNALVAELYKEGELDEIFAEAAHTKEARQRCAALVHALERSVEVLGELRQMRIAQC